MKLNRMIHLGLAAGVLAVFLPANNTPAAPAKKATYQVEEDTMVFTQPGTWFYGLLDNKLYIRGAEMTAEDHATDERLTGTVTLNYSAIWEGTMLVGPIWSYVKLENHHADAEKNGWWEGYCFGARELMADGENVLSWFEGTIEGRGIHQGLIARYWYIGTNVMDTLVLKGHGYVLDRGTPVRPLKVRSSRTDRAIIVPGIYLQPFTTIPVDGTIQTLMYWWIESATANNTHLGKATDQGFGLFDPATGAGSGMGHCLAANGDKLYWVVGTQALPGALSDVTLNLAGGTGRLEAAVGGFEATIKQELSQPDPENPLIIQMDLDYTAIGWMRY